MAVYFIEAVGAGLVKIGFTDGDPETRLGQLQTGSAHPLRLRHTTEGDQLRERRLHARFGHLRQSGEWFRLTVELEVWMCMDRTFTPVINGLTERIEQLEAMVDAEGPLYGEIGAIHDAARYAINLAEGRRRD